MLYVRRVSLLAPAMASFALVLVVGCSKTDTGAMHEGEASTDVGSTSHSGTTDPSSSVGSTTSASETSAASEHGESTATSHHGTTGGGEGSSTAGVDTSLDDGSETSSSTGEAVGCLDIHDEPTCEAEPYCEWLPQRQGPQGHCIWDCYAIADQAVCEASRQCVWGARMCMYPI